MLSADGGDDGGNVTSFYILLSKHVTQANRNIHQGESFQASGGVSDCWIPFFLQDVRIIKTTVIVTTMWELILSMVADCVYLVLLQESVTGGSQNSLTFSSTERTVSLRSYVTKEKIQSLIGPKLGCFIAACSLDILGHP
jgi:hypothetical protein